MRRGFSRTPTGIVGLRFFSPVPILWVEGPTDIYFYEPIVGHLRCRLKEFNGASNAAALIKALEENAHEYPYAVILDGDYNILKKRRSVHRWVVTLRRYSFENYLWEKTSLNRSCLRHAQRGDKEDVIGELFDKINNHLSERLRELVGLDIAARESDSGIKVFPNRIEILLLKPDEPNIRPNKVQRCIEAVRNKIQQESIDRAKKEVSAYLESRKFSDLLNGHVLLGVIRRVFTDITTALGGKKIVVNDEALIQLLAEMVWREIPSKEHARLRHKILSVVRQLNKVGVPRESEKKSTNE